MVILSDDEHLVKSEFCLSKFRWNDQMRLMLGKKFPIAAIRDRQTVALPSPHGSQKDKWYFPKSLVTKASGMKFINSISIQNLILNSKSPELEKCYYWRQIEGFPIDLLIHNSFLYFLLF